ncbi:retrovirus-related pol polyprotein from transposon TNT 1-94 [Tanacetum coccineum]
MLTRSMAAKLTSALASECLFTDFLSKIEPKKVYEALKHLRWVDAMQEKLNQFYRNKIWTLVSLPYGKTTIGSKWVFRNEKDEHGITTKNKARLVAQGYSQEEGIDYDEPLHYLMCKISVQSKGITSNCCEKNTLVLKRNSTSCACQILGGKLVCWSAKKQQSVDMSSAEAEYIAAAGCCAKLLLNRLYLRIAVIMEYLVKISKKARILELKRRYFEDYCSDIQYDVSIKQDTEYLCLHFTKEIRCIQRRPIRRIQDIANTFSLVGPLGDLGIDEYVLNQLNSSYLGLRKKYRLSLKNDMPP